MMSATITAETITIPNYSDNNTLKTNTDIQKIITKKRNYFIENKGQWNTEVRYLLRTNNYNAWITNYGIVYDYFEYYNDSINGDLNIKGNIFIMEFNNKNYNPNKNNDISKQPIEYKNIDEIVTKYNYFIGNDPEKWVANVPLYKEVVALNVFEGINIRYYVDTNNSNNLRYDFELKPNANPENIKYRFVGADKISVNSDGELEINVNEKTFKHTNLLAYQYINGQKQKVNCKFDAINVNDSEIIDISQNENLIGFTVGNYDKTQKLIIDPLIYSVLIGSLELELGYGIATDTSGCVYVTGDVRSPRFPTVAGSYNRIFNQDYNIAGGNNSDAFISKIDATGTQLLFSTFLGGSKSDMGRYIKIDHNMNVYVVGETNSVDSVAPHIQFPRITSNQSLAAIKNGWDVFVAKFNSTGNLMKFSILIGGNNNDYSGGLELIKNNLEQTQSIVVGAKINSCTVKPQTTTNAYNSQFAGGESDCYIAIIDTAGSQIKYATFLGGNNSDAPRTIAVDKNKNIYVAGNTSSPNFPITTGAFKSQIGGTSDIFITKFDTTLSNLVYSTFLGGTKQDTVNCISIDTSSCIYVTGSTFSNDFPTTNGAYSQQLKADTANIFVTKLNEQGSGLKYSTTISSNRQNYATGIVVDKNKNAHISGYTNSTNYPATWDAFFNDYSQFGDAIYSVFDSTGSNLLFSSFIGGPQYEYAYGLALDKIGTAYICGATTSQYQFPHSKVFTDSIQVIDSMYNSQTGKYEPYIRFETLGNYDIFIYKASYKPYPGELVTNINTFGNVFCPGSTVTINILTPHGFYYSDNIFYVQISDVNGNFSPSSTIIGSRQSNQGGTINITFPQNLTMGNKYRIRAISTKPRSIGEDNGIDLDIAPPNIKLDTNVIPINLCINKPIDIPIIANPCFDANNVFNIELSDNNGSFATPKIIGSKAATGSTIINTIIIDTINTGQNYKIRCAATAPKVNSNEVKLAVSLPSISFENNDSTSIQGLCDGENFKFEFLATKCFENDNIFYLILSDTTGSFDNKIDTIAKTISNGSNSKTTINGKIPENLPFSEKYKLKIVSTNPNQDTIVSFNGKIANFVLGKPFIFTDNINEIYVCRNLETDINLHTNNCFEQTNVFKIFIKIDTNWTLIGESKPNEKNITIKIPDNSKIKEKATVIVKSTKPVTLSDEVFINIVAPTIKIVNHTPTELCANSDFVILYNTNNCIKEKLNLNVELSNKNGDFNNPIIIGKSGIDDTTTSINCKLPKNIDENAKYYIRLVATNGLKSEKFPLNIQPATVNITTDITNLKVLCSGIELDLDFTVKGCFDTNNIFSVILSDISGNFTTSGSTVVGTIETKNSGKIKVHIPFETKESNSYKLKITSSNPKVESILDVNFTIKKPFIIIDSVKNVDLCDPSIPPKIDNQVQETVKDSSVVTFKTSDCYGNNNIFILQLGQNGNFNDPINIDTCQWNERKFTFLLPNNLGKNVYRMRIISVFPFLASSDNGFDIKYNQPYVALAGNGNISICRGKPTILSYISNSCFGSNNVFYLELSDSAGNFNTPIILDSNMKLYSGDFKVLIPDYLPKSGEYKLRIRSTVPVEYFVQFNINLLIDAPEILTGNLYRTRLARNDTLYVPFNTNCFDKDDKVFVVQLSDPYGTFNNILEIGSQIGWGDKGQIYARVSLKASDGKQYRIRVISKNPDVIGSDNGKDIVILGMATDINDNNYQDIIDVFPNPFDEKLFINVVKQNIGEQIKISISDILGRTRKQIYIDEQAKIEIETKDLENGVYCLIIETATQRYNLLILKHNLQNLN